MKILIIPFIVLLFLILFAIYFPRFYDKSPVPESFENLDKLMEKNNEEKESSIDELNKIKKPTFIMFFANWCHHCQRTKPEFNKLKLELEAEDEDIKIALVDCDDPAGKKLASENGVKVFPTFKLFPDGISGRRVIDCKTDRNVDSWNKFLKKHL